MDNDYRLQQIDKIHKKLEVERAKREKLSANYRKGLKILNATEGVLAVSFLGLNTVSVVVLSTVVAALTDPAIQAASLGAGLLFIIGGFVRRNLKPRAEKHEKIKLLVDERLNAINRFVSKAIDDDVVTDEEYSLVLFEYNKFIQKKEQIRAEAKSRMDKETLINRFKEKMRSKLR